MKEKLTAIFQKSPYGYIGFIEELPGANTQGTTLDEARKNLIEALHLVLDRTLMGIHFSPPKVTNIRF